MRIFRTPDLDLEASPAPAVRLELVRELVDQLPPDQQLVVSMYYFGAVQKTVAQIAEETHLSTSKVKGLLNDALRELRQRLDAMLEEYILGSVPAED